MFAGAVQYSPKPIMIMWFLGHLHGARNARQIILYLHGFQLDEPLMKHNLYAGLIGRLRQVMQPRRLFQPPKKLNGQILTNLYSRAAEPARRLILA